MLPVRQRLSVAPKPYLEVEIVSQKCTFSQASTVALSYFSLLSADFLVTLKKPNQQLYRKEQGASTNEVAKVMVIAQGPLL